MRTPGQTPHADTRSQRGFEFIFVAVDSAWVAFTARRRTCAIFLVRQARSDVLPYFSYHSVAWITSNHFNVKQPCNLSPSSLHCAFWQRSLLLCLPSKMSCKQEKLRTLPSFSQWDSPQTECQLLYDQSHPLPQHQTHQSSNWRTCPWSAYFSVFSPSVSSCQSFTHGIWSFTLTSTCWR